jgi:hypothetical protein
MDEDNNIKLNVQSYELAPMYQKTKKGSHVCRLILHSLQSPVDFEFKVRISNLSIFVIKLLSSSE